MPLGVFMYDLRLRSSQILLLSMLRDVDKRLYSLSFCLTFVSSWPSCLSHSLRYGDLEKGIQSPCFSKYFVMRAVCPITPDSGIILFGLCWNVELSLFSLLCVHDVLFGICLAFYFYERNIDMCLLLRFSSFT